MKVISVVIVTWNSAEVLEGCLASLLAHATSNRFELILVDNDSADKAYLDVAEARFRARVIRNRANLGFSKAVNIGADAATGDYLLLLNPDIVFHSDPFPRLLEELRKDPGIGVIAPLLLGTDGRPQLRNFYPAFPSLAQFVFFRSLLGTLPPVRRYAAPRFHARVGSSGLFFVDQIPGAFFLMRRDRFAGGPLLDESFFIWMEDVDFCMRLRRRGLKVGVVADETITHIGGFSFQSWSQPRRMWMFHNSYLNYLRLHLGLPAYLAHTAVMALSTLAFMAVTPFYQAPKGRRAVLERLHSEARVLALIARRVAERLCGRPSPPPFPLR